MTHNHHVALTPIRAQLYATLDAITLLDAYGLEHPAQILRSVAEILHVQLDDLAELATKDNV